MFGQLFRIVTAHRLTIPPEIAAVFRMLATIEGTLTELAPDLDLMTESRRIAAALLTDRVNPTLLKQAALDELASLTPILRRLPRRLERITNAAEHGRFAVNVRLLADERGRATITGLLHQVLVAFLAGVTGIMAVLLLAATFLCYAFQFLSTMGFLPTMLQERGLSPRAAGGLTALVVIANAFGAV